MNAILTTILVLGALGVVERVYTRWWSSRLLSRVLNEVRHPERHAAKSRPALDPESKFVVHLSDEALACERPDGQVERVLWADLQRVEILTTSDGPFLPDAFWALIGTHAGCVIPWGATGDRALLERMQQLPNFNNEAVIEAGTDDRRTVCWQRPV